MTEEEQKGIEGEVKYLMASLAMKYDVIPNHIIFQLISSTVMEFAIEELLKKSYKKTETFADMFLRGGGG